MQGLYNGSATRWGWAGPLKDTLFRPVGTVGGGRDRTTVRHGCRSGAVPRSSFACRGLTAGARPAETGRAIERHGCSVRWHEWRSTMTASNPADWPVILRGTSFEDHVVGRVFDH